MQNKDTQTLRYVALESIKNILKVEGNKDQKVKLFADCCRFNTLYMIENAGSGHIGSSFSSMDIFSLLFLDYLEIKGKSSLENDGDIFFSSKGHDVPGIYSVMWALELLEKDKNHFYQYQDIEELSSRSVWDLIF